MRDAHVGFFVVMSVLFPLVLVLMAVHWILGAFGTGILLATAYKTDQQEWAQLGMIADTRIITVAVLIGGTLLILAQSFG